MTKPKDKRQMLSNLLLILVPTTVLLWVCLVVLIYKKSYFWGLLQRSRHDLHIVIGFTKKKLNCLHRTDITEPEGQDQIQNLDTDLIRKKHTVDGGHEEEKKKLLVVFPSKKTGIEEVSLEENFRDRLTVDVYPEKETTQQSLQKTSTEKVNPEENFGDRLTVDVYLEKETTLPLNKNYQVSLRTNIPLSKLKNMGDDEIFNEFKRLSASTECKKMDETNPYELPKTRSLARKYQDSLNASYISGYNNARTYIVCTGPRAKETFLPFLNMVWDEGCDRIVMLTGCNVYDKGEQYWPETGGSVKHGDVIVKCNSLYHLEDDFIRRELVIKKGKEERIVLQHHFMAWPEDLVPNSIRSFTKFQKYRDSSTSENVVPVVVHCSNGIGRTGTYIAFESLIQEGKATGFVDVFDCVKRLREQRRSTVHKMGKQGKKMVQTFEQYSFLYKALNYWFNVAQEKNKKHQDVPMRIDDS